MDKLWQSYEFISRNCNFAVFLQSNMAENREKHTQKKKEDYSSFNLLKHHMMDYHILCFNRNICEYLKNITN